MTTQSSVVIGGRRIGPDEPAFVVAEGGVNHNGDPQLAHRIVEAAGAAGADAVKFQTFTPAHLVTGDAGTAPYQARNTGETTQRSMLESLVLPASAWSELAGHAAEEGLVFLSTAFDPASADLVDELGVPAFKVPSGELTNLAFIRDLAGRGRPLVISTGMATIEEVDAAVAAAGAAPGVCLLHCVTAYPAPPAASNLRAIPALAGRFGVPVGWSDHTRDATTALGALALGACLFEKHLTVDRSLPGPDHVASSTPDELAAYVNAIRELAGALGDGAKRPMEIERENRIYARRSVHAARDLTEGDELQPQDVVLLRPATGLAPDVAITGKRLRRAVGAGDPITADDLA